MNALFLPQQVTQNVTPPPHSMTVWADTHGKLWAQLPNQAPVQINTGNNALVPSNAPIQPAQAWVDNAGELGIGAYIATFDFANKGITSFVVGDDVTAPIYGAIEAAILGNGNMVLNINGNKLTMANVNQILAAMVDIQSGTGATASFVNLSGQTPSAPPTGQGIADKATLNGIGWTVVTD